MPSYTKAGAACNPVVAHLNGSRTCTGAGITATGAAPVLALCRELLAAGLDPDRALTVYRNGIVALRIRSIDEAAKLTVRESTRDGRPRFAQLSSDGGPPIRQNSPAYVGGRTAWSAAAE